MAAKITIANSSTETFDAPREHQGFRLPPQILAVVEDIAQGIEAGESGLKSCTLGASAAGDAGGSAPEVAARHAAEVVIIEDEDECFDRIGDLLAAGFSHEEVAKQVTLGGGATHLLALERWCDKVRLACDTDRVPSTELAGYAWRGGALHERRRRGHRAMEALRGAPGGVTHASVLHVVYGHPDPLLLWVSKHLQEQEAAPAGTTVAVDPADRERLAVARALLDLGREFAPLARYTDAVEASRLELAHQTAVRGASDRDGVVHLEHFASRLAREERCLSSGDGLRHAVAAFNEPMPVQGDTESPMAWEARKEARKGRRLEHEGSVAAFLTAVRVEANRMLTEASLAFRDAWMGS